MRIEFGTETTQANAHLVDEGTLCVPIPLVYGSSIEYPLPDYKSLPATGNQRYQSPEGLTVFAFTYPSDSKSLIESTHSHYLSLFQQTQNLHLYRVWTYIPQINEGESDRENYRLFCIGRAQAYEECFGADSETEMPAAACVGCEGNHITLIAIAGPKQPTHFENPDQVPAYRYPRRYGPKSPSFARATSIDLGTKRYRFISGTAAVIGHESVGVGDLAKQLQITSNNLETIASKSLEGARPARSTLAVGKVYLRDAKNLAAVKAYLEDRFPLWSKSLIYLQSDICREDLLLEIELSFVDQL